MSAPIVPFGTASAPSYLEGRAAAIQYATGLGFDESTFVEIPVRWGDMDSNSHVNNKVSFNWLETGRIQFMESVLGPIADRDPSKATGKGTGLILASVSNSYLRPAFAPDTILVAHKIVVVGEKKMILESLVYSFQQKAAIGKGDACLVFFDYGKNKSYAIPKEARDYLESKLPKKVASKL